MPDFQQDLFGGDFGTEDPLAQFSQTPPEIAPQVSPQTPSPDFASQFEKSVMDQFLGNNPEQIYKNKIAEYFKDMGVTPGTKKAKFAQMLREMTEAYRSSKVNTTQMPNGGIRQDVDMRGYRFPFERMRDSAQSEYERLMPGIRAEANIVGQNQRSEQKNITDFSKAKLKQESDNARTQAMYTWQMLRSGAIADKAKADVMWTDAKRKWYETTQKDMEDIFPGFAGLPKDQQSALVIGKLKKDLPDADFNDLIQAQLAQTNARKPSAQGAMMGLSNDEFNKYSGRDAQLEKNKLLGKYPPVGSAGGISLIKTLGKDEAGDPMAQYQLLNKREGTLAPLNGARPFDQKVVDIDNAAKIGEAQGREAFQTIVGLISSGQDSKVFGIGAGDPLSKVARSLGWTGTGKLTSEAILQATEKNLALQHTKTMFGGRYPIQAANAIESTLGGQTNDPRSVARSVAALVYSIQLMKMVNAGKLKPADVTDKFKQQVQSMIDSTISKAYANRSMRIKGNIDLPNLESIVATMIPKTPAQKAAADLGLN